MRSRIPSWTSAILLFAVLAIPVGLGAQQRNAQHHHFKLIDLGTLGGPQSWVFGWNEVPAPMSSDGAVFGGADSSSSNPFYPNFNPFMGLPFMLYPLNSDPFVEHAFQSKDAALVDLGTLPGGYNSFAQWISPNGTVVGASDNGSIDPITGWPEIRAVLWRGGQPVDLGDLDGGYESAAIAVNNRGDAVGAATDGAGNGRAVLWARGEGIRDLGTLGATSAIATLINDRRQVSGASALCDTCNQDTFFWEHGKMRGIPDFGGPISFPNAINSHGQIVGQQDLPGGANTHAFIWDKRNGVTDLGTLGGSGSTAHWINDAGDVVGGANTLTDQSFHATLWKHGNIIDLGTTAGDPCTLAHTVNSSDQIVGYTWDCVGTALHAFLWENGSIVDLNTLISPGSSLQLVMAISINDSGEIGGQGVTSAGDNHAFLLIPCDQHHPGIEGCDYSLVDAVAAVPHTSPTAHDTVGRTLPLLAVRRGYRFHIPGATTGPRN